MKVIALKLGVLIYAEQDVTSMDTTSLIEEAIQEDIYAKLTSPIKGEPSSGSRSYEAGSRVEIATRKTGLAESWTGMNAPPSILSRRKRRRSKRCSERIEILQDYSVADDMPARSADDLSGALHDVLECLKRAGQSHVGQY